MASRLPINPLPTRAPRWERCPRRSDRDCSLTADVLLTLTYLTLTCFTELVCEVDPPRLVAVTVQV